LARILKIDPSTLARIERGGGNITREVQMKLYCLFNKEEVCHITNLAE